MKSIFLQFTLRDEQLIIVNGDKTPVLIDGGESSINKYICLVFIFLSNDWCIL